MNLRLDGKNAIVCGSSQGIGKAIAWQYAEMGASTILLARNEENLKTVAESLPKSNNQEHSYIAVDFSEPETVIQKINKLLKEGKVFHILVNNSGGPAPGQIKSANAADFRLAFKQHVIMSQLLAQALIPGMMQTNYGRIINIISIGLKQPIDNLGVSNTIRGAMASWAKTLAREVAAYGITVNNLLPGYTKTTRLEALFQNRAKNENKTVAQIESEITAQIPALRLGSPEELAYAAGFLASEQASYINGISLPVDGGFLRCL